MNSNFSNISTNWVSVAQILQKAEKLVYADPSYAALECRKALEELVRWMYANDNELILPYDKSLANLIHTDSFKTLIAPNYLESLNSIRKLGNDAAHTNKKIPPQYALHTLQLMHNFVFWVQNIYSEERVSYPPFDIGLLPKVSEAEQERKKLSELLDAYHSQQEELEKTKATLEQFKEQKDHNLQHIPAPSDPDESLTRRMYIDALLMEAGWDPYGEHVPEYKLADCIPQANGTMGVGYADYVLWGEDGKPLAVVEAKKTTIDGRAGQHQAKLYADALERQFDQRPMIFFSSGFETWLWDDALNYPPRRVFGFYSQDELLMGIQRRTTRKDISTQRINDAITDRYYQHEAIRAVSEVLAKGHREALLVMATGTGKTRVAASIIDLLSKANWVKRVLFLADRNALITQAKNNLNTYLPNLPAVDLTQEKEAEGSRIVFSTYQTLINMIDGERDGNNRFYGVGHFDLIIFDEIHRSVYSKYKHIFRYFDGFRIGLTATPKSETDKDTYGLFGLEPSNPTFAYELGQGVADGFLVPPKAIGVPLRFQREGVKYKDLSEADKLAYEEEFADPLTGEIPNEIASEALNSWLFNQDTVDKVIGYLMQNGIKVESGDKLAKTIIFARSHKHALFIEERFNAQYPEYGGDFLKVIDNYERFKEDLLNHFKEPKKLPQIAVSVDMLDTGIDVPEICNLVFFKPVKSSTKYWQMIGRVPDCAKTYLVRILTKPNLLFLTFVKTLSFLVISPKAYQQILQKA